MQLLAAIKVVDEGKVVDAGRGKGGWHGNMIDRGIVWFLTTYRVFMRYCDRPAIKLNLFYCYPVKSNFLPVIRRMLTGHQHCIRFWRHWEFFFASFGCLASLGCWQYK